MPSLTRIENHALAIEVSSLGAELQSVTSRDGRSWLWNGDAVFWAGRSPILFPIVGKAIDNRVSIGGKTYEMNQHGFARRSEFALAETTETACRYELTATDATRAVYPFDFRLSLTHALEGHVLTLETVVDNLGAEPMPFGLGYHPAFVWPLPGAEGKPHMVSLENAAEPGLSTLDGGLRKPGLQPSPFREGHLVLDHALFADDALVFPEGAGDVLTYAAEGGPTLRFRFENLPNLALWTKPGAPFLCVEPWHGTAPMVDDGDALETRPFTMTLEPGGSARFAFSVEFPL